jgi:hypothetical protein
VNRIQEYTVNGYATVTVVANIKARSKAEAIKKAQGLSLPNLCHQCDGAGNQDEGQWTISGPWDDEVKAVEVEC